MLQIILAILLLEGFITISVEIVTMRQLLPFFGGSVVITSIIIGIFLLFLAIGYWRGGTYQRDFFKQLSRNFALSMLWVGIGLSYSVTAIYFYLTVAKLHMPYLVSLLGYLLLVLSPIVYWLGQTIPLTTNLFNQEHRVSRISGRALFISTIGSFLGALLTSLLLFQYLGVAWTVVINCVLLFAIVVMIQPHAKSPWYRVFMLLFALLFIFQMNVNTEKMLFIKTNNYANYQVVEPIAFDKILQINQSYSSLLTHDKKGFPYIELMRDILFNQLNLRNKQLLMIGAGGFSLTAKGTNDNEITYVDIDPAIKEIAERHFLNEPIKGKFIAQDARLFLNQNKSLFDVIVSDVYAHQATIPPALLTVEYFQNIAAHLKPSGLALFNIIANPLFQDDYSQIMHNTIHAAFPYCAVVPLNWDAPFTNIIYICPNIPVNKGIYSDDLNTATLDYFKSRHKSLR